ncbi:hypothetical protein [Rhodococcus wratislaviensis]|uniref:hypothetical protein n=1 Tax=Rhodococcus wratislaviensis TaxID=44752 RepID=UPI00351652D1
MTLKTSLSILGMVVIAVLSFHYMGRAGLHVARFDDVRTAALDVPDSNGLVVGSRVLLRGGRNRTHQRRDGVGRSHRGRVELRE